MTKRSSLHSCCSHLSISCMIDIGADSPMSASTFNNSICDKTESIDSKIRVNCLRHVLRAALRWSVNDCPVPWLFDNIPAGLVPHRTANDQLPSRCRLLLTCRLQTADALWSLVDSRWCSVVLSAAVMYG